MNYVECDLDAGLTLPQWRRIRAAGHARRRRPVSRLVRAGLRFAVIA